jgi:Spy/CpxP family protein refolding chaperone
MKTKLLILTAVSAAALASFTYLQAEEFDGHGPGPGHGPGHHMENPLQHLTESLNLTDAQKAQVQPIVDQAKPQIAAIHHEAMEKMRTVMETAAAQIRPLLTPEQQQKLDATKKAHEDMHKAMRELHDAQKK